MIKIITTEDGSNSLFDEDLNETYHSTRGARGESDHVYIREGLEHWLANNQAEEIKILEIGLGTGLNAFLTALFAKENDLKVQFSTLEPFPIAKEIYENLNFHNSEEEKKLLQEIHEDEWEQTLAVTPFFDLQKTKTKLENFKSEHHFNIIYFDAFAPSKQPEVWSPENLKKCFALLKPGGVLVTYCAQGQFKRNLADAGFEVETLQGAMGKKEMVRGLKY